MNRQAVFVFDAEINQKKEGETYVSEERNIIQIRVNKEIARNDINRFRTSIGGMVLDVVAYIVHILNEALKRRASDIHFEPHSKGLRIRQRVDGFLVEVAQVKPNDASAIISRLKIMGNLDIGEKRMPQDGTLTFTQLEGSYDVRISTIPTIHGEKVVLRFIKNRPEVNSLNDLGMSSTQLEQTERLLNRASGLVIVTGPTGSGKTTTLYAMLKYLNVVENNIITLEDPVELQIEGINQVQIHPKAGLTFAKSLRAALRQDPDIIMIGEIRDRETADIAIGAALTGHLVFTTLHTSDGASVVTRLLDMNIEAYRVAAALSGIIAQRLVRLVCKHCKGDRCSSCGNIGYAGRTGAFEVIAVDEPFKELIVDHVPLYQLRKYLRSQGIPSLKEAIMRKVDEGLTTQNECMRVINDEEEKILEV